MRHCELRGREKQKDRGTKRKLAVSCTARQRQQQVALVSTNKRLFTQPSHYINQEREREREREGERESLVEHKQLRLLSDASCPLQVADIIDSTAK